MKQNLCKAYQVDKLKKASKLRICELRYLFCIRKTYLWRIYLKLFIFALRFLWQPCVCYVSFQKLPLNGCAEHFIFLSNELNKKQAEWLMVVLQEAKKIWFFVFDQWNPI